MTRCEQFMGEFEAELKKNDPAFRLQELYLTVVDGRGDLLFDPDAEANDVLEFLETGLKIDAAQAVRRLVKADLYAPDEFDQELQMGRAECAESPDGRHQPNFQIMQAHRDAQSEKSGVIDTCCRYCAALGSAPLKPEDFHWE